MKWTKEPSSERVRQLRDELFGNDLGVDEVAELLDMDRTTILRYAREGVFDGAFQLGREWHIPLSGIQQHIERLKATAKPEPIDPEMLALRRELGNSAKIIAMNGGPSE